MNAWAEFAPLLIVTGRAWRRALTTMLVEHNQSDATAAPLIMLLRQGDRIPQGVLAERVGVEGPTLVRVLDGLENDGLIVRVPDDNDRRIKLVQLTEAGTKVAQCCEDLAAELREKFLGDLPAEKVTAAVEVMRAITHKSASFSGSSERDD